MAERMKYHFPTLANPFICFNQGRISPAPPLFLISSYYDQFYPSLKLPVYASNRSFEGVLAHHIQAKKGRVVGWTLPQGSFRSIINAISTGIQVSFVLPSEFFPLKKILLPNGCQAADIVDGNLGRS